MCFFFVILWTKVFVFCMGFNLCFSRTYWPGINQNHCVITEEKIGVEMKSINVAEKKTLKLQNVLSYCVDLSAENVNSLDMEVDKMNIYIKTHGAKQIGPLIQYSKVEQKEDGNAVVTIQFMLQSDKFINNVDKPYRMDGIHRVPDCLYARYIGPEENLKYAYDKLGVYAFENEISLEGGSYTIYVNRNEDEESIVADVFMPTKAS